MTSRDPFQPWLARLHHDLVKRLLWTARDCRELARQPLPGELLATLYDAEGQPVDAVTLWAQLRADALLDAAIDAAIDAPLDAFGAAVADCVELASRGDLAGVLRLEFEFEQLRAALALSLKATAGTGLGPERARE